MTMDSFLQAVENFRSLIENWGITNEALWTAGAIAAILFIVSLREVLAWFLKIQTIAEDLRHLRKEVRDLKQYMVVAREMSEIASQTEAAPVAVAATKEASDKRFPFDH